MIDIGRGKWNITSTRLRLTANNHLKQAEKDEQQNKDLEMNQKKNRELSIAGDRKRARQGRVGINCLLEVIWNLELSLQVTIDAVSESLTNILETSEMIAGNWLIYVLHFDLKNWKPSRWLLVWIVLQCLPNLMRHCSCKWALHTLDYLPFSIFLWNSVKSNWWNNIQILTDTNTQTVSNKLW